MNIERLRGMSNQELSQFGFFAAKEALPANPGPQIAVLFNGEDKKTFACQALPCELATQDDQGRPTTIEGFVLKPIKEI